MSVITCENYGGRDAVKILNKLLSYSGAKICDSIVLRNRFNENPMDDVLIKQRVDKAVNSFYRDIAERRRYRIQGLLHFIVFRLGIQPFVKKKGVEYEGVMNHWVNIKQKC